MSTYQPQGRGPATFVVAAEGKRAQLLVDGTYGSSPFNVVGAAFNAGALPGSGAWLRSQIISVKGIRRIHLSIKYNGAAGATGGYAQIIPLIACVDLSGSENAAPLYSDDVWDVPLITDGSLVAGALAAGTLPSNSGFTLTSKVGAAALYPAAYQIGSMTAASDKIRGSFDLNVEAASWLAFDVREIGDGAHPGTIDLYYTGSC